MIRLFTGIKLPHDIVTRLAMMKGGIVGADWTPPENYHITLTFIGNVDEGTAEDVDAILSSIHLPAFDLRLKGAGCFQHGDRLSHLWMGVELNDGLIRLKEKIDTAFKNKNIPFDRRDRYTPHVSIARLHTKEDLRTAEFIQEHNMFSTKPFHVSEFILYQSHQSKNGNFFEEKMNYELG